MPRRTDARGGGAKRGRGAKPHPGDARSKAKKPHQEASAGPGSGVLAGVGVADRVVPAPVRVVKARNMGGLGEGSRALILQMMHQLRLQDEEDERQRQQEEAQGGSAAGGASGPEKQVKCAAASVPKTSRMSAQHIAALEASLLASGDEEEEDEAGDGSSSSSSDDKEEGGNDGQLDGTFRRVANFLAKGNSGSSSGSGEEAEADEEENDEGSSSSSSEEGDEGAAAVQPQPTKKLSQRDQEMLLKTLIKDERKAYVAEQQAAQEAAMEAAVARKARAGKINIKVRVTLTAEKGGAKRLVVLERKKTLDGLLAVAKSKLKIKKPLRAYLADSRAAVENTLLLADDAVVVVTDRAKEAEEEGGEERGRRTGKPKREDKEKEGKPQAVPVDHEAELDVVKEAFKLRTEDRYDNGGPKGGAGVEQESARLKAALEERQASATFDDVRAQREGLPASRLREEIVRAVDRAQVVVVEGETGSGKTTQVPQFILDDWIARGQGAECSIVCTQPRRISAIGVAERVASERLEAVGQTVGYQIRLESRRSARTRLLFCTTGILLRRLMGDPELAGVSHIIVDEVHERSIESDFLLIILRDLMRQRPALKVVLMSATIEASLFSNYMGGCPCLHIPGRTHPVQVLYLGHIADMLEGGAVTASVAAFQSAARGGESRRDQRKDGKGKGPPSLPPPRAQQQQQAGGNGEEGEGGQDAERALAETFGAEEAQRLKTQLSARSDRIPIDYDLIVRLTRHVVEREAAARARGGGGGRGQQGGGKGGAVLVFLPGFAEIERAMGQMRRDPVLGDQGRARLFPLHSSVPTAAQKSVFCRLPEGVCKVVVATNIAETSITIDDISYVIDSCRVKETAFDPHTRMSSLREVWVSKAAASQRAGRAGRVRPGTCFRLVPEDHFQRALLDYTLPEIRRTTLEDLVLRVLMLELGQPKNFLGKAIQPPSDRAVDAAIRTLEEIEAVHIRPADGHIILRPLGFHLAALPLDVRLGKMLIISCIFDCLEPMLTVAAALSGKSVFTLPPGKREEAWLAKQRFADAKSDHLALVEVWKAWSRVKDEGRQAKKEFVRQNYLSMSALESLEAVRNQIRNDLVACGFAEPLSPEQQQQKQPPIQEIDYRANEYDVPLLKCILVAGLAPQIAKLVRPARGQGAHFLVRDGTKVFIHPGSVNAKRVREAGPGGREALALYHRKVETTRVYLHDTTFVSSLALLLFGTHVRIRREHGGVASKSTMVVVDAWIGFKMREESSVLLKVLKSKVDEVLLLKISRPHEDHVRRLRPVVSTIRKLLHAEMGKG